MDPEPRTDRRPARGRAGRGRAPARRRRFGARWLAGLPAGGLLALLICSPSAVAQEELLELLGQAERAQGTAAVLAPLAELDRRLAAGAALAAPDVERHALAVFESDALVPADDPDAIGRLARAAERCRAAGHGYLAPYLDDLRRQRLERASEYAAALALCDAAAAELEPTDWFALRFASSAADYARAIGDLEGSLARCDELLARDLPDDTAATVLGIRAQALVGLGVLDRAALDLVEALERAEAYHAATAAEGAPDAAPLVQALVRASELFVPMGRYDDVLATVERLRGLVAEDSVYLRLAECSRGLAHLERAYRDRALGRPSRDDRERAREAFEAVLAIEDAVPPIAVLARVSLAELARLEGDVDAARATLDGARARFEALVGYGAATGTSVRILGLLEVVGALLALDGGDRPARVAALERVSLAYERLLADWAATPVRPGGVAFLQERSRRAVLTTLCRLALDVDGDVRGAERAFGGYLAAQGLNTLARATGAPPVDLAAVRAQLAPGEVLVAFLPGVESAFVFTVDARSVHCDRLQASGERLRVAAEALNRDLRREPRGLPGEGERVAAAAAALAAELLPAATLERLAGAASVAFLGCELLGDAPVEALAAASDAPLGRGLAVSRWPSAALVVAGRNRPVVARVEPIAIVGDPARSARQAERWPELAPLPPDGSAPGVLARALGLDTAAAAVGADANRVALDRAGQSAVVTALVAHGLFDARRERPAGLLLADDRSAADAGAWYCADLDGLAASPVVLLLACGGARGARRLGDDGTTHLGGSFLAAGARAVVVASSEVSYRASVLFGMALVRALADGASVAEAAAAGRLAVAADGRFAHPFHWGAFQVIGDGAFRPFAARGDLAAALGPVPNARGAAPLVLGGAALLIAIAGAAVARRRRSRAGA